jgi:hypothetical protein
MLSCSKTVPRTHTCDILGHGLIILIGYTYQQGASSLAEARHQRASRLNILSWNNLRMSDRPESPSQVRTREDKVLRENW